MPRSTASSAAGIVALPGPRAVLEGSASAARRERRPCSNPSHHAGGRLEARRASWKGFKLVPWRPVRAAAWQEEGLERRARAGPRLRSLAPATLVASPPLSSSGTIPGLIRSRRLRAIGTTHVVIHVHVGDHSSSKTNAVKKRDFTHSRALLTLAKRTR